MMKSQIFYRNWMIVACCMILSSIGYSQYINGQFNSLQSSYFDGALLSYYVEDNSGKTLASSNHHMGMIPASTMKVVTSLAALNILGEDFQYKTKVWYNKKEQFGEVLEGNLQIQGSGDPSLGGPPESPGIPVKEVFDIIINSLRDVGVSCIEGNLILDIGVFDNEAVHRSWQWDDLTNYYASGVWGLNFMENQYQLTFNRSPKSGVPVTIASVEPSIPGLKIRSEVTTGPPRSGDNAYIFGNPYDHNRFVEGTIPPGSSPFTIKGAIPNPPLQFGNMLMKALADAGIRTQAVKIVSGSTTVKEDLLCEIASPPLSELVKYALYQSNNLYCDAFLKTMDQSGSPASYSGGAKAIEDKFQEMTAENMPVQIYDGSGLSLRNRISTHSLVKTIISGKDKFSFQQLTDWLPQAGFDGNVDYLLKGKKSKGHVWLKSGSLGGVLGYVGIIETAKNNQVFFSVISNGHNRGNSSIRRQMEKFFDEIYLHF